MQVQEGAQGALVALPALKQSTPASKVTGQLQGLNWGALMSSEPESLQPELNRQMLLEFRLELSHILGYTRPSRLILYGKEKSHLPGPGQDVD